MPQFIFTTGGVLSGIGKGTITSSIGLLLRSYGFRIVAIKIDPYLNTHAGNMSPLEHGEVYVLDDGTECDLDLGNYERFLNINLNKANSITTGQIYQQVIRNEQEGMYLGKTVQIIPHITDEITSRILEAGKVQVADLNGTIGDPDIVLVELGGTVGDIESEPFLYTLSHFPEPSCFLHIGLLVNNNGELKTKPLQHSVEALFSRGVIPDILCVRTDLPVNSVPTNIVEKVARSCHMKNLKAVIVSGKVNTIYQVPRILHEQGVCELICSKLGLLWRGTLRPNFDHYHKILDHYEQNNNQPTVRIGIVAKYASKGTPDTYLSVVRALEHASFHLHVRLETSFIDAEQLTNLDHDGIIIPGGFGDRGIAGKINAITEIRKRKLPLLGLCLGMQLMAIHECQRLFPEKALEYDSVEFRPNCEHPVTQQTDDGMMRLGLKSISLDANSLAAKAYGGKNIVAERHRHRFFVRPNMIMGELRCSATSEEMMIPEIIETTLDGWWAIGAQFHPEYLSRNNNPHPLFVEFLSQSQLKQK